mgnify:CR=1 FL=1
MKYLSLNKAALYIRFNVSVIIIEIPCSAKIGFTGISARTGTKTEENSPII